MFENLNVNVLCRDLGFFETVLLSRLPFGDSTTRSFYDSGYFYKLNKNLLKI